MERYVGKNREEALLNAAKAKGLVTAFTTIMVPRVSVMLASKEYTKLQTFSKSPTICIDVL